MQFHGHVNDEMFFLFLRYFLPADVAEYQKERKLGKD